MAGTTGKGGTGSITAVQVVSKIDIDLDEVLEGVAKLDTPDLERFVWQVGGLLARRRAPSLPVREAELLQSISQGATPQVKHRYHTLNAKLDEGSLSTEEHHELRGLIDIVEQADADRLAALMELAQLRGERLEILMHQLGIRPSVDVQTLHIR